jgi:hypothetical protein
MPICINPKCGQISKTLSKYCPHCGQESLSKLDKREIGEDTSSDISMASFERITSDVPAPKERKEKFSKHPRVLKGRFRRKKAWHPRISRVGFLRRKSLLVIMILLLGTYFVSSSYPDLFPVQVNSTFDKIESAVIQAFPNSEAYKMGYEKGSYYKNLADGAGALEKLFSDYNFDTSYDGQKLKPGDWGSTKMSKAQATIAAEGSWRFDGFLGMLENTEKNKADYVSGYLRGYFG